MKTKIIRLLLGAAIALTSTLASAHGNVSLGVYVGAPVVTYAPPPMYYAPPPVYYAPAPVYYAPPVYYYGPRYYAPVYVGPQLHDGRHRGPHHHRR